MPFENIATNEIHIKSQTKKYAAHTHTDILYVCVHNLCWHIQLLTASGHAASTIVFIVLIALLLLLLAVHQKTFIKYHAK